MFEDRILISRFKAGSMEAFRRIFDKYEGDLMTLATNLLTDANAAEDVLQEVFISFAQRIDRFQLTGSLKGYFVTCVVNRARDYLRKKQRQRTVSVEEAEYFESDLVSPVQIVIKDEQLEQLACAMRKLAYEQREVIVLHLHEGMKFKEIAKFQDVSNKTAQSRYRYGLDKLRSILNGEVEK